MQARLIALTRDVLEHHLALQIRRAVDGRVDYGDAAVCHASLSESGVVGKAETGAQAGPERAIGFGTRKLDVAAAIPPPQPVAGGDQIGRVGGAAHKRTLAVGRRIALIDVEADELMGSLRAATAGTQGTAHVQLRVAGEATIAAGPIAFQGRGTGYTKSELAGTAITNDHVGKCAKGASGQISRQHVALFAVDDLPGADLRIYLRSGEQQHRDQPRSDAFETGNSARVQNVSSPIAGMNRVRSGAVVPAFGGMDEFESNARVRTWASRHAAASSR